MVSSGAVRRRQRSFVTRQMSMLRRAVVVSGLLGVKVHVHQRRGKRTELHEHDKRRRGQPTKHTAIVCN